MNRILRKIAIVTGTVLSSIAALWLLTGAALALTPSPRFTKPPLDLPFDTPKAGPCRDAAGIRCFAVRDGARLAARTIEGPPGITVLYLHGVLGSSIGLAGSAGLLAESTGARVVSLDLRGHGLSEGRPGDVDHLGQYEEDVADVLAILRRENPAGRLVLAGHSMGGGVALRVAARREAIGRAAAAVDGTLLLAPLLGMTSPTERKAPAASAGPGDEALLKLHVKRLIGLAMLNAVGIRGLNRLDTLFFNMGRGFQVRKYTFRAVASMAPDDYRAALSAGDEPMLVLVGRNDEAFHAEAYPAVIALHRNSRTLLVDGATHDGLTGNASALASAADWMRDQGWAAAGIVAPGGIVPAT